MKALLFFLTVSIFCFGQLPPASEWEKLNQAVGGRLIYQKNPFTLSQIDEIVKIYQNPYLVQEQPWGTELTGWLQAWATVASPYVLAAQNTDDIVAAVNFARKHKVKLAIKGCAHDYLGRSCAPNSLLIWTYAMRNVTLHEAFIPEGAPPKTTSLQAVSVQAGARWIDVYTAVTTNGHRYVQGGGCTTVGAAGGFLQGGGFGSFSKMYGTGAGNLLEAEVVLANGDVVIANDYQNSDLFWALKGGGGGTFGVVTRATLRTHELPQNFGSIDGKVTAISDSSFQKLLEKFIHFYQKHLNNEHWGEQVTIHPDNTLQMHLCFAGLNEKQVQKIWEPFIKWVKTQPDNYSIKTEITTVSAEHWWDRDFWLKKGLGNVTVYKDDLYYWKGNQGEVGAYIYAHRTRWLPLALFKRNDFANTLFNASRHWAIALHFNKGLSGTSKETIRREKKTALNPIVLESAALAIIAAIDQGIYPGIPGHEPDLKKGHEISEKVNAAAQILFEAAPNSGSYSNETDYFEKNWQESFWGKNYPRLLQIKRKYDPENLFQNHHSVGS